MSTPQQLDKLRLVITENLRVQRGGAEHVPYIDVTSALSDVKAVKTMQFLQDEDVAKLYYYIIQKKS